MMLLLHRFLPRHEDSGEAFDEFSLPSVEIASLRDEVDGSGDFGISGECNNLQNLGFLGHIDSSLAPLIKVLNVTNNSLEDGALACASLPRLTPALRLLHLGGNNLQSVMHLGGALPWSLRVLDLSHSEGLVFDRNCFVNCPQVEEHSLDGCGLESMLVRAAAGKRDGSNGAANDSIFFGLISLVNLSLNENNLSRKC